MLTVVQMAAMKAGHLVALLADKMVGKTVDKMVGLLDRWLADYWVCYLD